MNQHVPIGNGVRLPVLHDPEPVQLLTPQLFEAYAPLMWEHFCKVVERNGITDFTADDIIEMARNGSCVLLAVVNDRTGLNPDREVFLSFALEVVTYPQKSGINILAIGGSDVGEYHAKFWEQFKGWAFMNGAKFIEASVGPAMQRMLKKWNFKYQRTLVRLDLPEKPNGY